MNIEEIRQTRVEAERVIFEVLRVFKETTGMAVIGVGLGTYSVSNIGGLYEISPVVTTVRLKIEPI